MQASVTYIAASTNRYSYAADVSDEFVAFGSSNQICLWKVDEPDATIQQTLHGHDGLVTCVRWVSADCFLSGDDKGVIRLWHRRGVQWSSVQYQAHNNAVSVICVYEGCLATGSSDSTVKIWSLDGSGLEELQALSLKGRYPFTIAISRLPKSSSLVLAVGGTDKFISLWTRSEKGTFVPSSSLSGHEDWIRSLSFSVSSSDSASLMLASGSQDSTIRLWKFVIYSQNQQNSSENVDELLDAFEASLGEPSEGEEGGRQISLKRHILTVKPDQGSLQRFSVTFDALLIGHEAGITCLSWRPSLQRDSVPTLLSTSTDSSLILWSPSTIISGSGDEATALWINRARFGDVGGQRFGGFVGGLWRTDGSQAMAWGWAGGWRIWQSSDPSAGEETWVEVGAMGGHRGPVKDICWSPKGDYFISTGLDQTTRIHGPVPNSNGPSWHELARPQVHGYDLQGVVFVDQLQFVSIADEKVVRVFDAPKNFITLLETLRVSTFSEAERARPGSASVPPLGLSNKASEDSTSHESAILSRRPFEGELASMTLWPESEKIFGHGYETITVAVSHSRKLIATACRATTPEHAVIRLYNTDGWQAAGVPLQGHALTVTRIVFSPDDRYILSVSRDRAWRLFELQEDGGYKPSAFDKSHGRIIWDSAWAPEGDVFATASRDKTVRVWLQASGQWSVAAMIKTPHAATAVDFLAEDAEDRRYLAIGTEVGNILVYRNSRGSTDWTLECTCEAHTKHIHRLAWRPTKKSVELASCSDDGCIKLINFVVP